MKIYLATMLLFFMVIASSSTTRATTPWHIFATNTIPSCGVTTLSYVGANSDGSVIAFVRPDCVEEFWTSN